MTGAAVKCCVIAGVYGACMSMGGCIFRKTRRLVVVLCLAFYFLSDHNFFPWTCYISPTGGLLIARTTAISHCRKSTLWPGHVSMQMEPDSQLLLCIVCLSVCAWVCAQYILPFICCTYIIHFSVWMCIFTLLCDFKFTPILCCLQQYIFLFCCSDVSSAWI